MLKQSSLALFKLYKFLKFQAFILFAFISTCTSFSIYGATTPSNACKDLYTATTKLVTGKDPQLTSTNIAKPKQGIAELDDLYGLCRIRMTDYKNEPPRGFIRNDYSRRQPLNADDSLLLTYAKDGYWHLYKTDSRHYYKKLNLGGGSVEPQWHPNDPDSLYLLSNNGGLSIYRYNVHTDSRDKVTDFTSVKAINGYANTSDIRDIWPTAARVWTKSEGSPSIDARYWGFQVETENFKPLGLITYDMQTNQILGVFDFKFDGNGIGRPDHVSMSPSGEYIVPSWHVPNDCRPNNRVGNKEEPCGLMVYTRDFEHGYGITSRGPHSDIAINTDGHDIIVISNYVTGYVEMHDLKTRKMTRLFSLYLGGSATAMHISGKAYNKPGWVLVSTYATKKQPQWWSNKIFAVELNRSPKIYNITHTYNVTKGYWSEPHAVVNKDFTKVIFNTNWLVPGEDIDVYMIELPNNAMR